MVCPPVGRLTILPLVTVANADRHPAPNDRGWPPNDEDWRDRAACLGLEPEIFYPLTDEEAAVAREICDGCEVRTECLEYALARREKDGVWGGATERDRRRIIRQRRRAARLAQTA